MNKILKELDQFPQGPKVSMFLEWKAMDHTFEEVRVWLSNIISELRERGEEIPPIIKRIMSDQRVLGSELKLNGRLKLGEKYGVLFFGGDRILSVNMPLRSKDTYFVDKDFFILPLLKSAQPLPVLALFVKQTSVRLFKVSHYKDIVEITPNFQFPKDTRSLSHFDSGSETGSVQNGEEPRQIDHRQGYQEELLKKFVCQTATELSKAFGSFSRIHIFSSDKMLHLFEKEIEKINKGIKVISHSFILSHFTAPNFKKVIREKVIEAESLSSFGEEEEFSKMPVKDVRELIWEQELGNLKKLRLNERWLADALGRGTERDQLKTLNQFVLDCLRKNVEVRLSSQIDDLLAGELHGDRVRVPRDYESPQFHNLEEIRY